MRTQDQIVKRIKRTGVEDFFGTNTDLMVYLDFEHAREFLKKNVTKAEWDKDHMDFDRDRTVEDMRKYMVFAWDKAVNHRGLSASRSIDHFCNWLYMLEDDELLEFSESGNNYAYYGVPILKKICDKYGFDVPKGESVQRMSEGKPCHEGCDECNGGP